MTEPGGDVLTDPVAAVVAVVTTVDPAVDRDTVRAAVEQAGGRARRRRLAVALAADPSLLTSGRSPAPTVVGDLLLALRAAGATGISPPRCAGCDRGITSLQRHGQDWYCCVCVRRLALRPCASCGQRRPVASRDRVGQPRCERCPDRDERDPLAVLTAIISGLDPSLRADMAAGAARRVFARQGNLRRLAWAVEARPSLLTGEGAQAPAAAVLRLIDELCAAGAETITRPACPHCGRVVRLHRRLNGQWSCRNCVAKASAVSCSRCGAAREPATRDAGGQPLCPNCLVSDPVNLEECARCGRRRRVNTRLADGPVCASCAPQTIASCSVCGRTTPCIVSKTTGQPWCRACARWQAECSRCGQLAAIRAGTRQAPLCASCAVPDPGFWKACAACGASGRLLAGICRRCQLRRQLGELLAGPGGQVRPELRLLHDTLASAGRPDTVLNWLKRAATRTVLAELAAGQRPLSHAALDDLTPGKPIEHLRAVLVATAALPARDEQLARIERWSARPSASTPARTTRNCCTATRPGTCCDGSGSATGAPPPPMASSTRSGNGCVPRPACSAGCASAGSPWPAAPKPTWAPGWPARTPPAKPKPATSSAGRSPVASTATCSSPPPGGPAPSARWITTDAGSRPGGCCTTAPSPPATGSPGCWCCFTPSGPRRSAASPSTTSTPATARSGSASGRCP